MGLFNTNKQLDASPSMIPQISEAIETEFRKDGYEVTAQKLMYGGKEISITKGGLFKAILGLKTALKIKLVPQEGRIAFGAGVGIFGMQVIPTCLSLFVTWPVLITQIWGMVQQSKLDDKALDLAEREISRQPKEGHHQHPSFMTCPYDGSLIPAGSEFCPYCGKKIKEAVL